MVHTYLGETIHFHRGQTILKFLMILCIFLRLKIRSNRSLASRPVDDCR